MSDAADFQRVLDWLIANPHASLDAQAQQLRTLDEDTRKALLIMATDAKARMDIHSFADSVMKDQAGKALKTRAIDRAIQKHFEDCKRDGMYCGVLAPVGSGKSVGLVMIRALWEICQDTNTMIKVICSTDEEAIKRLVGIGKVIAHSPEFARIWGHKVKPGQVKTRSESEWSKHKLYIQRTSGSVEPTVEAYGVTASAQGSRANLLIFDDCVDARTALESPALKVMVRDKIENQWLSRVVLHDHMIIWVATRWTNDDQSSVLMENECWRFLEIRVSDDMLRLEADIMERGVITESFEVPMLPTWDVAYLNKQLSSQSEVAFNRSYRQRPWSREDCTFPSFPKCKRTDIDIEDVIRQARSEQWKVYTGVDLSSAKRRGTAIVTFGMNDQGKRHLLDARIGNWTQPEIGQQLNDVDGRFHPLVFAIESVALQESFIEAWKAAPQTYTFWQRIQPFLTTGQKKSDPAFGIRTLDIQFWNEGWVFPAAHLDKHKRFGGDHQNRCGLCLIFPEFGSYPMYSSNDLVLALWFATTCAETFSAMNADDISEVLESVPEDPWYNTPLDSLGRSTHDDDDEDIPYDFV